ncbi:uncharacterized protein LOC117123531 [Anneissia japonica]|uniref:uncharacterized protein LOC117123531 n=1 Tax=Anneissia japonica TaxID=1529436 RepID=UPI0014257E94|nr:uncharacterized protein LOC117123531 [Anneissia japonica]
MCRLLCYIAGVAMYITYISSCTDFSYSSSNYKVVRITASLSWLDVSSICKSSGRQLVSLNTAGESAALLEFLATNCHNGMYAIGLSRQPGFDRHISANWIWETGEAYEGEINWIPSDPNEQDSVHCGVRIKAANGKFADANVDRDLTNSIYSTYGYICEKHLSISQNSAYFQTTQSLARCRHHDAVGKMSAHCFRCALKCFKDDGCLAFKYDEVGGCQVKSDLIENTQFYYTRLWV